MSTADQSRRVWLGAKVTPDLYAQVGALATRVGLTQSQVVRVVLKHTDAERLLGDLRREANAVPAAGAA